MQTAEVLITNENGLHTRPAACFVKACKKFSSTVTVENKGKQVNAKSLIKLMGAGVVKNDTIKIHVDGEDEQEAVAFLKDFAEKLEG